MYLLWQEALDRSQAAFLHLQHELNTCGSPAEYQAVMSPVLEVLCLLHVCAQWPIVCQG